MTYQKYENLGGPNDVLSKMREFALANGWSILENLTPDLAIDETGVVDGLRLSIQKGNIYAHFRTANGEAIFQTQNNAAKATKAKCAYGIGLVCSTGYSSTPPSGYWFDQPNATKHKATQQVIGAGISVKKDANLRLHCNAITEPEIMIMFSLELEEGLFQHLAVANVQKVGAWAGGTIYSGSKNSVTMFPVDWSPTTIENLSNHLFGMSAQASTFLRCDIDAAPLRNPPVLWASAGPDGSDISQCFTGKILGLPVTNLNVLGEAWFPKIPHYAYLQSQSATDVGRNVNTLNCISVNIPLALYVQRDPDSLRNYSQVGYVPGMNCISMRNVAPGQTYEISYPQSGNLYQVFPHVRRGGAFGYDGISVKQ
ncbi:hypothetical protein [Sporomusa sp. KB1]|jgi:hypothetical protein|uniref:hypothetical protein n=1 Tax=Sporomusa sp. KB1 TaxID=943346 RepID=UPI0011A05412|nr:hypothetical protein [Sporomusa sp. KB1]TWH48559.1 hypothetical protein Salpa_4724 [Sporomusa sp. KB1]